VKESPLPLIGSQVLTTCGGETQFDTDTPRAIYEGGWVFFCTPECRNKFDQDPNSSCLAEQIQNVED
jgi:YHS domain-containing protein